MVDCQMLDHLEDEWLTLVCSGRALFLLQRKRPPSLTESDSPKSLHLESQVFFGQVVGYNIFIIIFDFLRTPTLPKKNLGFLLGRRRFIQQGVKM